MSEYIALKGNKEINLNEFGLELKYINVNDPDNNSTDKYLLFYHDTTKKKNDDMYYWTPTSSLLTGVYSIANMIEINTRLKNEYMDTITFKKPEIHKCSVRLLYELNNFNVELSDEDIEKNMVLYKLLFGEDIKQIEKNQKIILTITNSYDGSSKFDISYQLYTKSDKGEYSNSYLFMNEHKSILHKSSTIITISDLINIKTKVADIISQMKNKNVDDSKLIDNVKMLCRERLAAKILNIWGSLSSDMKNKYYLTCILSGLPSNTFNNFKTILNRC